MLNQILITTCIILLSIYFYSSRKYGYWRKKNVVHYGPSIVLKTLRDQIFGRETIGAIQQKWYNEHKNKKVRYFGSWTIFQPTLFLMDFDLCKYVLTKDFNHFVSRDLFFSTHEFINRNLLTLEGQEWKEMRIKLTPTFSSGIMKNMFVLVEKCSKQLTKHIDEVVLVKEEFPVKDLFARLTTDVIATCAFGLETNCIDNPENEFYKTSKLIFSATPRTLISFLFIKVFPTLASILDIQTFDHRIPEFFTKLMEDTIEYRKKNNVVRNDFVDLLLQVKEYKYLDVDDDDSERSIRQTQNKNENGLPGKVRLTLKEMTAQAFLFFIAGLETVSSTASFCLYELAKHQDIQEKLREEVDQVLANHGGEITYQGLQEMTYMDQVINETLRRYSSLPVVLRGCTKRYQFPDTDLTIDKGVRVSIPVHAIHHDPDIYPEPYKFDPERFSEEGIRNRHHYAFLPFGEGPRNCIGMRFGRLQVKVSLAAILSRYQFAPAPDTPSTLEINPFSVITSPKHPFKLRITKRTG